MNEEIGSAPEMMCKGPNSLSFCKMTLNQLN